MWAGRGPLVPQGTLSRKDKSLVRDAPGVEKRFGNLIPVPSDTLTRFHFSLESVSSYG
jgi:hypothetical protein